MMSVVGDRPVLWLTVRSLIGGGPYADDNMGRWNVALLRRLRALPEHARVRLGRRTSGRLVHRGRDPLHLRRLRGARAPDRQRAGRGVPAPARAAPAASSAEPVAALRRSAVRTAVISDLHLGLGSGADLLRRERFRDRAVRASSRAPTGWCCSATCSSFATARWREVLDGRGPGARRRSPSALAGRELVIVPGNHDHHLIEPWLERRALDGAGPLELEQVGPPEGLAFEALAEHARRRRGPLRLPGSVAARRRLRDARPLPRPPPDRADDRAARGRRWSSACSGSPTTGRDPLAPPGSPRRADDRRVRARADAGLRAALRARPGDRRRAPRRRQPLGAPVADDGRRRGRGSARVRGWLLGSVARARARSGSPTGSGSARCAPTSRLGAIGRAGFEAMADVVDDARDRGRAPDLRPHPPSRRPRGRRRGRRSGTRAAGSTRPACSATRRR